MTNAMTSGPSPTSGHVTGTMTHAHSAAVQGATRAPRTLTSTRGIAILMHGGLNVTVTVVSATWIHVTRSLAICVCHAEWTASSSANRTKLRQIDLHWHDLRHEGACRLLADGVDIRIIQLMLGHASVQQTQRYLNVTDEELRKGLEISWKRRTLKAVSGG